MYVRREITRFLCTPIHSKKKYESKVIWKIHKLFEAQRFSVDKIFYS